MTKSDGPVADSVTWTPERMANERHFRPAGHKAMYRALHCEIIHVM